MGDSQKAKGSAYGQLKHVEVLRNRVVDTGFRCGYSPWTSIPAISVDLPETCEVAGNIVDTSFAQTHANTCANRSGSRTTQRAVGSADASLMPFASVPITLLVKELRASGRLMVKTLSGFSTP